MKRRTVGRIFAPCGEWVACRDWVAGPERIARTVETVTAAHHGRDAASSRIA